MEGPTCDKLCRGETTASLSCLNRASVTSEQCDGLLHTHTPGLIPYSVHVRAYPNKAPFLKSSNSIIFPYFVRGD